MSGTAPTWLPVIGWEGLYEVSDRGEVRSLDRVDRFGRRYAGRVLSTDTIKGGYLRVALAREGIVKRRQVHHLVLESFVSSRPPGMEGCHGDGNPVNNRLDNLRWGTRPENALDTVRHGTHRNARKTHCPRGHALIEPNITAEARRNGRRSCLACSRAHGSGKPFTKDLADEYYAQMGVAA